LIDSFFTPAFYVKWAVIVFSFPAEHKLIKNKAQHIFDLQNAARGTAPAGGKEPEKETKGAIQVSGRLKKVLAMGEPFPEEPWLIRKFVYLAASIGIATAAQQVAAIISGRLPAIGDMVRVAAGPFLYGEEKQPSAIDHAFEIDAYPVTNGQFAEFIAAKGYENKEFWSKAGLAWLAQEKVKAPRYWDDEKWNRPEHPVVGVTYYEAEAYAKWAGKRLPTEQEWEKAARGDNGQQYPWGDEFDTSLCNTKESGVGATTPVNQYPGGKSPYGCYDMAGNVLEWTASYRADRDNTPVLRGGSWNYSRDSARCAARNRSSPNNWNFLVGFRCAREVQE